MFVLAAVNSEANAVWARVYPDRSRVEGAVSRIVKGLDDPDVKGVIRISEPFTSLVVYRWDNWHKAWQYHNTPWRDK